MGLDFILVTGVFIICVFSFMVGFIFNEFIRTTDDEKMEFSKRLDK